MTKFLIGVLVVLGLFFTWFGMRSKTNLYTQCMKNYSNNDKCTCMSNKFIDTLGGSTITGFNISLDMLTNGHLIADTYEASRKACNLSDSDRSIEATLQTIIDTIFGSTKQEKEASHR